MRESLAQLIGRAESLAAKAKCPFHSGHLLLAIVTGDDVAARTLTLRGVTETRVRGMLREDYTESEAIRQSVFESAKRIANSFRVTTLSSIHVLAALATVKECCSYRMLIDMSLNTDMIRNQAIQNMLSSYTRERVTQNGTQLRITALPEPAPFSTRRKTRKKNPADRPSARVSGSPTTGTPLRMDPGVGRELEQVQQKTRASQGSLDNSVNRIVPSQRKQTLVAAQTDLTKMPLLSTLGRQITAEARDGLLRPIVGRVLEMEQVADILNKKRARCPCVTGASGVGKTALVEGLAQSMVTGTLTGIPFDTIVEVQPGNLLSGTSMRGELCDRIAGIVTELKQCDGRVLLFLDDVHQLFSIPEAQEGVSELRAAIVRGDLTCLFSTTETEYSRWFQDPSMARLITKVELEEPSVEESRRILDAVVPEYEAYHGVDYHPQALDAAIRLSSRYIQGEALPDKAISVLDLAGAQVRRRMGSEVRREDVAAVLARKIGVPQERLAGSEGERLLHLEEALGGDIIGHETIHRAIGETLRRNAAGFRTGRPIGSFLFLGPTGVGKTETAKSLARILFADENVMIRIDMSEFSEAHSVARMLGAPPGYIGHDEGGQLTEAVRRRPYSLVLFDEIEKAHRDVIQSLLQVLDDGRMTDGRGKTVSFSNTLIIMTSNLGADMRKMEKSRRRVGFGNGQSSSGAFSEGVIEAARNVLSPELWNRIDEPLVFAPLEEDDVACIADLMLRRISDQIRDEKGVILEFDDEVIQRLIDEGGYDPQLGARPMRRTISRLIEGPAARRILEMGGQRGRIRVTCPKGKRVFDVTVMESESPVH